MSAFTKTLYIISFLTSPFLLSAQSYELLAPIGSIENVSSFATYLDSALIFGMGAGTGLAVLMVAAGGIQMIFAAGNPSKIGEGRERIKQAIWGLVILALSALILETINPDLINIKLQ